MDQEMGSLWHKIETVSCDAARQLKKAVDTENDLHTLTREDLNELLPGAENFQMRKKIMGIIAKTSPEQAGPSVNSHPNVSPATDREPEPISRAVLLKIHDGLTRLESQQLENLVLIGSYIERIEKLMKECPEQVENAKGCPVQQHSTPEQESSVDQQNSPHSKQEGSVGKRTSRSGQLSSSEPECKRSSIAKLSPVKVHVLLGGNTLDAHKTFMKQLKVKMNECSVESCSVVLLFCPIASRIGTDMEEAMKKAPDNKPVILVIMHHHHDPNLVLSPPVQLPKENIVKVVQCVFHESQGLLQCERNVKAIKEVNSALEKYKREGQ